ncbi:MAG: choice-of-anchor tandem repeat GloVer-containing protein [Candidatus Cybelea sp.]
MASPNGYRDLLVPCVALLTLLTAGCSVSNNPAMPGAVSFGAIGAKPSRELVLQKFTSPTYGGDLPSPLTPDGAGNYYGTTTVGGLGYGTLYKLSPNGNGRWTETVVHAFKNYLDGGFPAFTPLIVDKHRDLYGTTQEGGLNGLGVAFRFHGTAHGWVETVLHNFGNGDAYPFNSLIMDGAANLYGTDTVYHYGGGLTEGVYEISPSKGGWLYKIIYDLGMPAANGVSGGLVLDPHGNIFGLSCGLIEPAIVFELERTSSGWRPNILYRFENVATYPLGAPVLDKAGNIYGTTQGGGAKKQGTVYRLRPSKTGSWKLETLYAFKGGADGGYPYAGITFDGSSNIYGTTFGSTPNSGTVFELRAGRYNEKVLWTFDGKDGSAPVAPVTLDGAGNLFGTTSSGGGGHHCLQAAGCGNAFELTR